MNILRGLMLIGSLGKVWSHTKVARNIYSSISIVAYFKLLNDFENGNSNIVVVPDIVPPRAPEPPQPIKRTKKFAVQRHRERLKETMRNVNRIVNEY